MRPGQRLQPCVEHSSAAVATVSLGGSESLYVQRGEDRYARYKPPCKVGYPERNLGMSETAAASNQLSVVVRVLSCLCGVGVARGGECRQSECVVMLHCNPKFVVEKQIGQTLKYQVTQRSVE